MSGQNNFSTGTLRGRLIRVFLLQALAISVAVVVGVFAAAKVVEQILVQEALDGEAEHYWALYENDHDYARPNTNNLRGYLRRQGSGDLLPDWLDDLQPGFQRISHDGGDPLVHVSENDGARLYLVFDEIQVSRLAFYFGVAPLSLVLLLVYTVSWIAYKLSRSAVSPLVQLARRVESFDAKASTLKALDFETTASQDIEVRSLAEALQGFVERINEFVTRERNFTRNASHELRTPLAVMRANLDALQRRSGGNPEIAVPLERMRRTVTDMEKLLETLLILAREDESRLPSEAIVINDLVMERVAQIHRAIGNELVEVSVEAECLLQVQAPQKVLSIVFDNLMRNAITYTSEGKVMVRIKPGKVIIEDNGPGIEPEVLEKIFEPFQRGETEFKGFGLGLAIVKRLCDRFGWKVTMSSEAGQGASAIIEMPDAEVIGQKA